MIGIATTGLSTVAQESELVHLCPEKPCWIQFVHEGVSIDDTGNRVEVFGRNVVRFLYKTSIENEDHWWIEFEASFSGSGIEDFQHTLHARTRSGLAVGQSPAGRGETGLVPAFSNGPQAAAATGPATRRPGKAMVSPRLIRFDYAPEIELLQERSVSVKDVEYRCSSFHWTEQPPEGVETGKHIEHTVLVAADDSKLPLALITWVTKTSKLEKKGDFEFRFQLVDFGDDPEPAIPLDDDDP